MRACADRGQGGPRGSRTRSKAALELVRSRSGIAIHEAAAVMAIQQNGRPA
jgi:hypothetical protein